MLQLIAIDQFKFITGFINGTGAVNFNDFYLEFNDNLPFL